MLSPNHRTTEMRGVGCGLVAAAAAAAEVGVVSLYVMTCRNGELSFLATSSKSQRGIEDGIFPVVEPS